ncbi:Cytoplasmic protein [Rhodotorula toruloides ATCC 204091]|uniref:Cytoplasmic protein n=1 Tax=Rhodotorula toruloides TaxID=5286 RepID=A0A0K3CBQ8_RHOTO|nr:Cytoplasmic protein [Rhodotorula toruloides ATCC 204091]KAK4334598.1 Cytoplasmic protein [Rhodotorula toruloides]PRQ75413.1 cytoplasmic protein [Rhodotorula toruloides]
MAPSLWRRPGTKTFQLVHRSQRDPLINDPSASDRVLKLVDRSQKKHRGDGATSYAASESAGVEDDEEDAKLAAGDAAAYGIFYDDADEYDYLQHLRSVGGGGESYLIEAPSQQDSKQKGKGKAKDLGGFELSEEALRRQDAQQSGAPAPFEMPEDVLPSHPLDEVSYDKIMASKAPERGLMPDLDPNIREVLEALDDEAYAADDGTGTDDEDEFWNGVLEGGEVQDKSEQVWEDDEAEGVAEGVEKLALDGDEGAGGADDQWAALKRFKAAGGAGAGASDDEDEEDYGSEGGDTIADLRATLATAKRPSRKSGMSAAGSAFSMSSSAMFRNEQLRTLDDRFDQIEKLYDEESDDSWGEGSDDDEGPDPSILPQGAARDDLERIMDDFLAKYEVIGGKYRPALEPLSGGGAGDDSIAANTSRLDRLRAELAKLDLGEEEEGEDPEVTARRREKERILAIVERQQREESSRKKKDRLPMVTIIEDQQKERWDCETVLSTYSNLSNHPRMLRLRDSRGPKPAQIKLDPKTGFPTVNGETVFDGRPSAKKDGDTIMEEDEPEEDEEEEEEYVIRETVKRPRAETADDKKARKAAVKAERAARRQEKKGTKEAFESETKRQKRIQGRRVAEGGAADIRSGQVGVRRLA